MLAVNKIEEIKIYSKLVCSPHSIIIDIEGKVSFQSKLLINLAHVFKFPLKNLLFLILTRNLKYGNLISLLLLISFRKFRRFLL
jgi:hypothetical protein